MTVEEKISHIREAAMEEARARGNEIIDQHQKALEGVFKTHKQEAVMQADTRIKTETASARQQLNTVTSKGQLKLRRQLSRVQNELKNKLFEEVREMAEETWKAGNMLYPLPAVMVSVSDGEGNDNIITVAWAGTVCTNPPMVSISVRPSRFSYDMLRKTGEFVINLTTEKLAYATDYCGVRSGRDVDKFKEMKLTKEKADFVKVPMIAESPVSIECKVRQVLELGSHHMFLADVLAVHADPQYMDEKKKFHLNDAKPLVYSHGEYLGIGKKLGTFGYSVKKKKKKSGKKKQ